METKRMKQADLEAVLLDFRVEAGGGPKPAILEDYCTRYPQFAPELTDYAVQWLIGDAVAVSGTDSVAGEHASSALVSRAISRLYDRIQERDVARDASTRSANQQPEDIFEGLTVERVRTIRDALGIDTPIMSKLRNRLIEPETVRRPFLDRFAASLERPVDAVIAYLRQPPTVHVQASFKAEGKPAANVQKESFDDAVRKSSLDEKRKQALLKD